jgi:hypothetical protein
MPRSAGPLRIGGHHRWFARSPFSTAFIPELDAAIINLRDVLGDQTYEGLARNGSAMTTAAIVTYAYDQIDQARAVLNAVSQVSRSNTTAESGTPTSSNAPSARPAWRVKVIGRLPGEASCLNLVWAVLDRASRGWRGMTMARPAPGCSTTHATNYSTHRRRYDPPTPPRSPGRRNCRGRRLT